MFKLLPADKQWANQVTTLPNLVVVVLSGLASDTAKACFDITRFPYRCLALKRMTGANLSSTGGRRISMSPSALGACSNHSSATRGSGGSFRQSFSKKRIDLAVDSLGYFRSNSWPTSR